MSDIDAALKAEIDKHLPTMVGKQLQERLVQADRDARDLKICRDSIDTLEAKNKKLESLKINEAELYDREGKVSGREFQVGVKEQLLALREKHAEERVLELRNITQSVFGSNRMGYNLNLNVPNPNYGQKDQYGNMLIGSYDQTASITGKVEKSE